MTGPSRDPANNARGPRALIVTRGVLEEARAFFEERGTEGCEGTALIAGKPGPECTSLGNVLILPDQVATPTPYASVTVTPAGDLELLTALAPDELYLARIHSHPGLAFHSKTDDANPVLTQQGAISIVVPFFGLGLRRGLEACAVYVRQGRAWRELPTNTAERAKWVREDV